MNKLSVWKRKMAKEKRKREEQWGNSNINALSRFFRTEMEKAGFYGPFKSGG